MGTNSFPSGASNWISVLPPSSTLASSPPVPLSRLFLCEHSDALAPAIHFGESERNLWVTNDIRCLRPGRPCTAGVSTHSWTPKTNGTLIRWNPSEYGACFLMIAIYCPPPLQAAPRVPFFHALPAIVIMQEWEKWYKLCHFAFLILQALQQCVASSALNIVLPSPPACASDALVPGVQPEPRTHNSDNTSGALKL